MISRYPWAASALVLCAILIATGACSEEGPSPVEPPPAPLGGDLRPCGASSAAAAPASASLAAATRAGQGTDAADLPVLGLGQVDDRFTSELWVHGSWAYTGTWGSRASGRQPGNMLKIWDVSADVPVLRDSVVIGRDTVHTLGDVQVTEDGRLLVVATEPVGSIRVLSLADPARPCELSRFSDPSVQGGVHTAEIARVDGTLHAFLSVPAVSQLVVVDLSDPRNPRQVLAQRMGEPFLHDVFVRDGLLFTAIWNGGITIWDIGGGGRGGSPAAPVRISSIETEGGYAHNVWWGGRDSGPISSRYVFVGEEAPPFQFGVRATGDVHVVDISDIENPREVAFFGVAGAGSHNFSVDEERGIFYAAFYNGGVRALDATGELGACAEEAHVGGRCDLRAMGREIGTALTDREVFVWGVRRAGSHLYASDLLNGLWKIDPSPLHR